MRKGRNILLALALCLMAFQLFGCSSSSTEEEVVEDDSTEEANVEEDETIGASEDIEILETSSEDVTVSEGSVTVTIGNKTIELSGAYVIDGEDVVIEGGTYSSTTSDQNVFLVVNGGSLTISNATIEKTGDASGSDSERSQDVSDDYNFYGLNSVILVVGEDSSATITDCIITSNASGANAVFASDEASITISNVSITTEGNSSRGVYATYSGSIDADHLTITTEGSHCAPIATDRGGGYVNVSYSLVSSNGDGSPCIYSTGEITVDHVTGTATGAQIAVVEGKNSVTMTDCDFTATGDGNNGIMLYQSTSGDAADEDATSTNSTITITNTTLTVENDGPLFYVTNTSSTINWNEGNSYSTTSGLFVEAGSDRWGQDGSNGGIVYIITNETIDDDEITYDDISSITISEA